MKQLFIELLRSIQFLTQLQQQDNTQRELNNLIIGLWKVYQTYFIDTNQPYIGEAIKELPESLHSLLFD